MPLPDVRSGEDISPAERAKLDKEVESYAQEMEAFWKAKADARDWDSVRANLEVYALAGEKVTEDPRRTEAYRDLVWEGLKVEPGPTRPGLTAADVAAIKEVVRRKAAGFDRPVRLLGADHGTRCPPPRGCLSRGRCICRATAEGPQRRTHRAVRPCMYGSSCPQSDECPCNARR